MQRKLEPIFALLFPGAVRYRVGERARKRRASMSTKTVMLGSAVLVGTRPPVFLAHGYTGRYGSSYFPSVLGVTCAGAGAVLRLLRIWHNTAQGLRQARP